MRGVTTERVASRKRDHDGHARVNGHLARFDCDYSMESIGSSRIMFTPAIFQNPA